MQNALAIIYGNLQAVCINLHWQYTQLQFEKNINISLSMEYNTTVRNAVQTV